MELRMFLSVLTAVVTVVTYYFYDRLRTARFKKYAHIDSPGPPSFLWGHMKLIGQYFTNAPASYHSDYIFEKMNDDCGNKELLMIDLRPLRPPIGIIFTHNLAEQISKPTRRMPYAPGKPDASKKDLIHVLGHKNIIFADGDEWKRLRKRFNPGFAPSHLLSLIPQIMEKSLIFIDNLEKAAASGKEFRMDDLCTGLTFDIIGDVVLGVDFNAQKPVEEQSEFVRIFRQQLKSFFVQKSRVLGLLEVPWSWIARRQRHLRIDVLLKKIIREKYAVMRAQLNSAERVKSRSVLALSVSNGEEDLTSELLQITVDQVRSFLFAGHDTTSILLQRIFYALSIHPKALATVRAEIAAIFGTSDPRKIAAIIDERADTVFRQMTYSSAVIKETLRLWPPAGAVRCVYEGDDFTLQLSDGRALDVNGITLYGMHHSIHRDPLVFGDTFADFIPERWLGDTSTASEDPDHVSRSAGDDATANANGHMNGRVDTSKIQKVPASAWRPFERGPRNCIGQELANIEARAIMALVAQRYDFEKTGLGKTKLDEATGKPFLAGGDGGVAGRFELESELYNARQITAKPVDGTMMKVHIAEGQA